MTADSFALVRLERSHLEPLCEMAREFRAEGDPRLDRVLEDPDGFFAEVDRFEAGRDLPDDRVPQFYYLLFRGDRPLGGARLRHRLIPVLQLDGGNIGYEIRPSERGRGYASELRRRMLDEARALGLSHVLLTAEASNAPSLRVIEKAGGRTDGRTVSPNTGAEMRRFWIDL